MIANDTDGSVTFILTAVEDSASLGRFRSSESGNAPALVLRYEAIPEPGALSLVALGTALLWRRPRRVERPA